MDGQDGGEQHVVTVITYPDPVQLLKHALVDDTPVRRVGIGAVVQVFVLDGVQLGFLHQKHGLRLVSGDAHPVERVYIIGHRVAVGLQQGLV